MLKPLRSSVTHGTEVLAILAAFVPAGIKLIYFPNNIGSDDAYIHLRVATNFAHGLGWGINPNEPVNLSTAPVFTLILAAAERLSVHAIGIVQIISGAAVVVGLLAIFLTVLAETASVLAAFFAELTAAFSNNLWRWNGTLMEATFAFAIVAITLFLLRRGKTQTLHSAGVLGITLGAGVLLRPEMGILCILSAFVLAIRSEGGLRMRELLMMAICLVGVLTSWVIFAHRVHISVVPTTFAAKSVHGLILVNPRIITRITESVVESFFISALFVFILICISLKTRRWNKLDPISYVITAGWVLGVFAFYYLKTSGLESTGRYLLPLLPAEVTLLALLWKSLFAEGTSWQRNATVSVLAVNGIFALALNQFLISPVLRRFEDEYAASMRAAAAELTQKTASLNNRRVLVLVDIGVLSYAADGKFEIFDGGALATPSLQGLSVAKQIEQVQPSFVVQSLAASPRGLGDTMPDRLKEVWERRFFRFSIGEPQPYYYVIIFASKAS